jgi:tetratricopeptide (TPR) repeat protein
MSGNISPMSTHRLNSWKEIASFFGKDERTVKCWEARGLPVHRVPGGTRASVYAFSGELDSWLRTAGPADLAPNADRDPDIRPAAQPLVPKPFWTRLRTTAAGTLAGAAIAASLFLIFGSNLGRPAPDISTSPGRPMAGGADDLYLTGMYHWNTRTPQGLNRAVHYFTESITRDPNYAPAYAGLANCYNLLSQYTIMPPDETYPRAKAAAERALALDPKSVTALNALAFNAYYWNWDFERSAGLFRRALKIDPRSPEGLHWYALTLMHAGSMEEPLRAISDAQHAAPESRSILANKALILFHAGRAADAISILTQMQETDPDFLAPRAYLATIYLDQGRYRDFLNEARDAARIENSPAHLAIVTAAEQGFSRDGAKGMLLAMFDAQKAAYANGQEPAFNVARTAALLDDRREMIDFLKISVSKREPEVLGIRIEPSFRAVRGDPAYRALVTQVGLPLPDPTTN